ncbi:hypothetical protein [Rhizobium leguminosarum]
MRNFPGIIVFGFAIPHGKPLRTFPGIIVFGFAIPHGKPLRTFPGIAVVGFAIPDGKPLRTFPGIALGNLAQALATVREYRRLAMMLPSGKQLGRIPGGERPLCWVSGGGVLTISVPVKGA